MQISQSDIVRLRRARWRVLDVRGYDGCQVVLVAGVEPRNAGTTRRFVLPFDDVERVERRVQPVRTSRRQWRRACLGLLAAAAPPGGLVAAREARIDLLPHQLEPALAVVRGLGSRVLLADDVGLGKTVQAGLIVAELRSRGAADRVLIVTPAGLRDQWAHELSERFGLPAEVVDVRALRQQSASLPLGMNPWESLSLAIASIDYVKRPEVLAAAVAPRWDVVVVDEAHGVAADSERHAAISALAKRTPYVVLASATPHNGNRREFVSLCALGAAGDEPLLLFHRSRHDVHVGGRRRVHRLQVRMSRDEASMHALLLRFSRSVRRQLRSQQGSACWLALSVLHKRALSSSRSLQLSLERRLAALASVDRQANQLQLPLDDSAGEFTAGDETPVWPAAIALDDPAEERRLLGELLEVASQASRHESKINALRRLLRRVDEPAIVFTEYRDTLRHLRRELSLPCQTLHGGMNRHERQAEIERFTSGRSRLLLATDAAAEGLNLQSACRLIVNLELPWNPMRLEQRIGRVDRIGQRRPVHVCHLIARDSAEGQILARLRRRIATVRSDIGGADPLSADPPLSSVATESLRTPSLTQEAVEETARIASARIFAGAAETKSAIPVVPDAPLVVRTRRWQTRTALAGHRLMLWRLVAEDGCGRFVGSRLVALTVANGAEASLVQLGMSANDAGAAWRARVAAIQHAFVDARLGRLSALQRVRHARSRPSEATFQSGLFERRLDRARLAGDAARQAADENQGERLEILRRSRVLHFPPPQLQLVLVP